MTTATEQMHSAGLGMAIANSAEQESSFTPLMLLTKADSPDVKLMIQWGIAPEIARTTGIRYWRSGIIAGVVDKAINSLPSELRDSVVVADLDDYDSAAMRGMPLIADLTRTTSRKVMPASDFGIDASTHDLLYWIECILHDWSQRHGRQLHVRVLQHADDKRRMVQG